MVSFVFPRPPLFCDHLTDIEKNRKSSQNSEIDMMPNSYKSEFHLAWNTFMIMMFNLQSMYTELSYFKNDIIYVFN